MNKTPATIIRQIGGVTVAVIGCAGLVLPVVPGWLLIGAGAIILLPGDSHAGKAIRRRLRRREDALIARLEERRTMEGAHRAA